MYGPAKKGMRLWAHFLPRLVQGFSRASLETRWKMSPSSFFAAITGRGQKKEYEMKNCKQCGQLTDNANGFCCDACRNEYYVSGAGKSSNLYYPIKFIVWTLPRFFIKLALKCAKIIWKVIVNKWVITIFTAGLSYITWKGLDKIYGKK